MKVKKKFVSWLLTLTMVLGMLPAMSLTAAAEGKLEPPVKKIMLGAGGIHDWSADSGYSYVYFGEYAQSESEERDGWKAEPIIWRVLDADHTNMVDESGNLIPGAFLLSEQNLDVMQYHVTESSVTWAESTMRSWLNGYGASANIQKADYSGDNFLGTAFDGKEKVAILQTHVVNDANPAHGTNGGELTDDKVFLLSIGEVQESGYGFTDDNSCKSTNTAYVYAKDTRNMMSDGKADCWWLRSPGKASNYATYVDWNGAVNRNGNRVDSKDYAVRPAFNLNLDSVLFTSAAEGGKAGAEGVLSAVGNNTTRYWKLTLLDEGREFTASFESADDDVWTISYSGAKTGENEYVSAMLVNSAGEATYYGRLKQVPESTDASGTVTVQLPAAFYEESDTLYVFNEQYNGGTDDASKWTDYASNFAGVIPTPTEAYACDTTGDGNVDDYIVLVLFGSIYKDEIGNIYVPVYDAEGGIAFFKAIDDDDRDGVYKDRSRDPDLYVMIDTDRDGEPDSLVQVYDNYGTGIYTDNDGNVYINTVSDYYYSPAYTDPNSEYPGVYYNDDNEPFVMVDTDGDDKPDSVNNVKFVDGKVVDVESGRTLEQDPTGSFYTFSGVTVRGQILSYNRSNDILVQLMKDGVEMYSVTIEGTEGQGRFTDDFEIEGVEPGTYDLVVSKPGHLKYTVEGVVVGNDDLDFAACTNEPYAVITLLAGDINGDGSIDFGDLDELLSVTNYGKSNVSVPFAKGAEW